MTQWETDPNQTAERKKTELALQESQQRLQAIFDHALEAIFLADDAARYVEVNPAACELLGYPHKILIQMTLWELTPDINREAAQALWHRFIETGQQQGELTLVGRDKRLIEVEYHAVANIVPGLHLSVLRDVTERKRADAERGALVEAVSQQREQLRALSRRLAALQEAERKVIAQELHDQVGQQLTALNLNLNFIRTQLAKILPQPMASIQTCLDDSLSLVEQTTERIQDVMTELRPPVLEDFGLLAALRWYADQLADRVNFTLTIEGEEPATRLIPSIELAFFRITQEALTNVIKHAQATQVLIQFETDDEFAGLIIADDGVGFDLTGWVNRPERRHSWGLLTMIERAEALRGYCHIESRPGQGTRIIVDIPR